MAFRVNASFKHILRSPPPEIGGNVNKLTVMILVFSQPFRSLAVIVYCPSCVFVAIFVTKISSSLESIEANPFGPLHVSEAALGRFALTYNGSLTHLLRAEGLNAGRGATLIFAVKLEVHPLLFAVIVYAANSEVEELLVKVTVNGELVGLVWLFAPLIVAGALTVHV